jgi:acyl carrier protein
LSQTSTSSTSVESLLSTFREVAVDVVERDLPTFGVETAIADLAIDSLALYEVMGELERRLGARFDDGDLVGVTTVGDLLALVAERAGAA